VTSVWAFAGAVKASTRTIAANDNNSFRIILSPLEFLPRAAVRLKMSPPFGGAHCVTERSALTTPLQRRDELR
jgi:hypothetical protein